MPSLYTYKDCQEKVGSRVESKGCSIIPFPDHPHRSKRSKKCGRSLLKSVEVKLGKKILYPYKLYCYTPLKSSLQKLFVRSFYEQCQHWKTRSLDGSLNDVYDGGSYPRST